MGYALPWNVRGIDPDIKELAVEAAHRAGMPVGQWLSHVLADTIPDMLDDEEDDYLPLRARKSRKSRRLEEMNYRLERLLRPRAQMSARRARHDEEEEAPVYELLETALRAMERGGERRGGERKESFSPARHILDEEHPRPGKPSASADKAPVADPSAAILQAIQSLEAQVSSLKQEKDLQSETTIQPVSLNVPVLDTSAQSGTRPFTKNDPAIIGAIEEIEARRRALNHDSAPKSAVKPALPARPPILSPPASLAQAEAAPRAHQPDPMMDDLRKRLDLIVSRMDDMHAKPPLENQVLQAKLDEITARMDEAKSKPGDVIDPIQAKLDQIVARLDSVTSAPREEELAIQAKLDQITARLDAAQTLARPEAAQLQAQLESISKRMEHVSSPVAEAKSLQARLDDIATRIEEVRSSSKEPSLLQERVDHIAGRIDQWKAPTTDDLTQIRRDIANLSGALEALSPQRLVGVVENAVAQIAEKSFHAQQQNMPERLIEPIEQIQYDIREVLREVGSSRISDRLTHEVSIIARKLDQIGHGTADIGRLEDVLRETNAIKSLVGQALRNQPLEGLAHQIETLGAQLDQYRINPQGVQDQQILDTINDIRDRMERIDPQATFSGMEARLKVIADIEARLGSITGIEEKLGEIARNVTKLTKEKRTTGTGSANTALPQLETIAEKLEQIDKAIDSARAAPSPELDAIVRKLDEIGSSIDRATSQPTPPAPAPEAMEKQQMLAHLLERLSAKMEQAEAPSSNSSALDALQDEIARLTNRIEMGTGNSLPGLEDMSRTISNLCNDIESAKKDMLAAAETAAEKAAREAIRNFARDESTDTLAAEGLLLMRRDLGEFKSAQTESEQRTQKTLETLQSTLQGLVGRLTEMEAAPKAAMAQKAPQAAPSAPSAAPAFAPTLSGAPAPAGAPAKAGATAKAQKVVQAVDYNDLPLEPGLQPDRAAQPQEPISADPRSNFIAAARRAAQTAAEQSQAILDEVDEEKSGGRNRMRATRGKSEAHGKSASFLTRSRKPILLGLAALVFAAGAVSLMSQRERMPEVDGNISLPELPVPSPSQNKAPVKTGEAINPAINGQQGAGTSATSSSQAPTAPPVKLGKIETKLEDTPGKQAARMAEANTQTDPVIVGSIPVTERVQDTLPANLALAELANQSGLKAPDKLRDAALAANPAALFEVAARFVDGRAGLAKDPQLAARWFEQAANMGHAPAQYRLAGLYREGRGVAKDPAAAFQWFDRAATQGHILAMHNAAVLLAEGVHGTPDYAGAALWFKRAAEHGVKDSQFNVAILFARGLGVNQDLAESYRWFSAAAAQGDQDAVKKRDDIAARLTKDQLAKEKVWLKNFTPVKPLPAANEPGDWDADAARTASTAPSTNPAPKTQRAK